MAFFKASILHSRKDGMYVVYIRVTQNRKCNYIRTSWVVSEKGLSKDKRDIIDPILLEQTSKVITEYYNTLNKIDTRNWTVREVVAYLMSGVDDLSFSDYARKHIQKLIASGHERTSRNYRYAINHMERFAETDNIMFSRLTSAFLNRWIESLVLTNRCKEQYPVCMREGHGWNLGSTLCYLGCGSAHSRPRSPRCIPRRTCDHPHK